MGVFIGLSAAFYAAVGMSFFALEGDKDKAFYCSLFRAAAMVIFALILFATGRASVATELYSFCFACLSGASVALATLCSFTALSLKGVDEFAFFDKLTIPFSVFAARIFFAQKISTAAYISFAFVAISLFFALANLFSKTKKGAKESAKGSLKDSFVFIAAALSFDVLITLSGVLSRLSLRGTGAFGAFFYKTLFAFITTLIIIFIAKTRKRSLKALPSPIGTFGAIGSGITAGFSWLCYTVCLLSEGYLRAFALEKFSLLPSLALSFFIYAQKPNRTSLLSALFATLSLLVLLL